MANEYAVPFCSSRTMNCRSANGSCVSSPGVGFSRSTRQPTTRGSSSKQQWIFCLPVEEELVLGSKGELAKVYEASPASAPGGKE